MTNKIEDNFGGNLTDYPNDKYKKFFEKFSEIQSLEVKQWKPVHVLAYFCNRYFSTYNINYKFKFNSPSPSKCFEVFQIKRLAMSLSSDPIILKQYIDHVYETKVKNSKRKLTSISFLNQEETVNDYKMNVLLANKEDLRIDRSSPLPTQYEKIISQYNSYIKTYGDLAFLYRAHSSSDKEMFDNLLSEGFDLGILSRIL